MLQSLKIGNWDGVNKNKVRLTKLNYVRRFINRNKDKSFVPRMLTFPGTKARLENMLSINNVVSPSNIVAIQTYENMSDSHKGEPLLKELMKTRNTYLKGMYIWPYNFESFTENYKLECCTKPEGKPRSKFNIPPYSKEMTSVVNRPATTFNILDLDYCGIFSSKNAGSVETLMKNKILDDRGLLFITHQKGRDVRGGNLLNILNGYLQNNSLIDYDSIPFVYDDEKEYRYYAARYIMIPAYYVSKAFDNGYLMKLERLIEYRDKNVDSGLAVNMLQFVFSWMKFDYITYDVAKSTVMKEMDKIRLEEYEFTDWID